MSSIKKAPVLKIVSQQLALSLQWADHATFENFIPGQNTQLLKHLSHVVQGTGEFCTFLYSLHEGIALTHLLQASCHASTQAGKTAAYLSFKNAQFSPEVLEGMESVDLLCLDDIEQIIGQHQWELALFELYHRIQDKNTHLLVAAHGLPKQMNWLLPDLQSRFAAAVVFQLHSLSDEEKLIFLKQRAAARGLNLSEEVGHYLLNHYPRDMHILIHTLEVLDKAALVAQRRLTVPFVKAVLANT